jgi:Tfp pilus assembly protein PilO
MKLSYKKQLYSLSVAIFISAVFIFGYLIFALHASNQTLFEENESLIKEYLSLKSEQERYELGKKELAVLSEKPNQPEFFFSTDTSLVKEITVLEQMAKDLNLNMSLSVSGSLAKAKKVDGLTGDIFTIPYSINLVGNINDITSYLSGMEKLFFVTHVQGVSMTADEEGKLRAIISAVFYIKKP